jgi:hypothetical protein
VPGSHWTTTKSKVIWGNGFGLQNITHAFGGLADAVILAMCCRMEPTGTLAGMIDWICHLVLDALSGGIPLWWPSVDARQLDKVWITG